MSSQTLFNSLLVDTAKEILPYKDEVEEQSKIVNDVSNYLLWIYFLILLKTPLCVERSL